MGVVHLWMSDRFRARRTKSGVPGSVRPFVWVVTPPSDLWDPSPLSEVLVFGSGPRGVPVLLDD